MPVFIRVKVQGHVGFYVSCMHNTAGTTRSGFTKCHSLDGATLPTEAAAAAATHGQYLALSKA